MTDRLDGPSQDPAASRALTYAAAPISEAVRRLPSPRSQRSRPHGPDGVLEGEFADEAGVALVAFGAALVVGLLGDEVPDGQEEELLAGLPDEGGAAFVGERIRLGGAVVDPRLGRGAGRRRRDVRGHEHLGPDFRRARGVARQGIPRIQRRWETPAEASDVAEGRAGHRRPRHPRSEVAAASLGVRRK